MLATTRAPCTATVNDWGARVVTRRRLLEATPRPRLEVLDRVGGGDVRFRLVYGLVLDGADWP